MDESTYLDQGVLWIEYQLLAESPADRLSLFESIGVVLTQPVGTYSSNRLRFSEEQWNAFRSWLSTGAAGDLLRLEGDAVRVLRPQIEHIVVGTGLLLQDLATSDRKPRPRRLLLDVWVAAQRAAFAL